MNAVVEVVEVDEKWNKLNLVLEQIVEERLQKGIGDIFL